MKIFSKIPVRYHNLATDQVEVRTHYYLLDWNFYTSRRQEVISHQPPDEIKNALMGINNIALKKIEQEDWELWSVENKREGQTIYSNGMVSLNANHSTFNGYRTGSPVLNLSTSMVLPRDKDWIFKVTGSLSTDYGGGGVNLGLSREKDANAVNFGLTTGSYASLSIMGGKGTVGRENFTFIIVKVGGVLFQSLYQGANNIAHTTNAFTEAGDYHPKAILGRGAMNLMAYYRILN